MKGVRNLPGSNSGDRRFRVLCAALPTDNAGSPPEKGIGVDVSISIVDPGVPDSGQQSRTRRGDPPGTVAKDEKACQVGSGRGAVTIFRAVAVIAGVRSRVFDDAAGRGHPAALQLEPLMRPAY